MSTRGKKGQRQERSGLGLPEVTHCFSESTLRSRAAVIYMPTSQCQAYLLVLREAVSKNFVLEATLQREQEMSLQLSDKATC